MNACNANAQQGQNAPPAAPPHARSTSGQPGPTATSTPNVKGNSKTHDVKPNVASTSSGAVPSRGGGPTAQNHPLQHPPKDNSTSTGPALAPPHHPPAAQAYSKPPPQEERRVSFAPQLAAGTSTATAVAKPAPPPPPAAVETEAEVDIPDDASEFLFNSDDDAFLAMVDLGEEGLGGPIDFDEGFGGVEVGDESKAEVLDSRQEGGPPPQAWGHPPQAQHPTDPRAARPPQPPHRQVAASSTLATISTSTSRRQQFSSAGSHIANQSSRDCDVSSTPLAQSPPAMGGFHYPTPNSVRIPLASHSLRLRAHQLTPHVGFETKYDIHGASRRAYPRGRATQLQLCRWECDRLEAQCGCHAVRYHSMAPVNPYIVSC